MGAGERPSTDTRRAVTLGLAAGALSAPTWARAQTTPAPTAAPDPPSVVRASTDLDDRMTVPVLIDGQGPYAFVVDTGSNRTVVSDTLARQLNLPGGRTISLHSATGPIDTATAPVGALQVGQRRMRNLVAPVLNAGNLGAVGILGIDAVADQRIVMDFLGNKMSIGDTAARRDDSGAVVVRARSKYGQLLLVDSWVEGVPIYVIVDTGGEISIGNSVLRAMLTKRRSEEPTPTKVISVSGESVMADLTYLPRVNLGNVIISNLQIAYADIYTFRKFGLADKPAMLLGMNILRYFGRVSIDFPARQVSFNFKPV
jgi:predicted aspartyl protease